MEWGTCELRTTRNSFETPAGTAAPRRAGDVAVMDPSCRRRGARTSSDVRIRRSRDFRQRYAKSRSHRRPDRRDAVIAGRTHDRAGCDMSSTGGAPRPGISMMRRGRRGSKAGYRERSRSRFPTRVVRISPSGRARGGPAQRRTRSISLRAGVARTRQCDGYRYSARAMSSRRNQCRYPCISRECRRATRATAGLASRPGTHPRHPSGR